MNYPVRVIPILYNRLSFALDALPKKLPRKDDASLEFVSHHLPQIMEEFTSGWDNLLVNPNHTDDQTRLVLTNFESIPALFTVEGRMRDGIIEIRNIKIYLNPEKTRDE